LTPLSLTDIATIKVALDLAAQQFPDDPRYAITYKRLCLQFAGAVASTTDELIAASRQPAFTRLQAGE